MRHGGVGQLFTLDRLGLSFASFTALATAAATSAPTAAPATAAGTIFLRSTSVGALFFLLSFFLLLGLILVFRKFVLEIFLDRGRLRTALLCHRPRTGAFHRHPSAFESLVDGDFDRDAVPLLDLGEFSALLVEEIDRSLATGAEQNLLAASARRFVLNDA
jgi:hypothetical protein